MSRTQRIRLLVLAAIIAVAAVVIASRGGSTETTVSAATVTVRAAKPVGGVQTIRFRKGGTIDLTVRSDTADEIHFHGYDVHKDVAKGGTVRFRISATIEGRFLVELENHKQEIASVEVVS